MKIEFEDHSYIEVSKSDNPNMVYLIIAAKHAEDNHTIVVNSVEITTEQLLSLVKSLH